MKYEAHITVEPSGSWDYFADHVARETNWKVSKFEVDEVDGIAGKWFLSFASDNRDQMLLGVPLMVRFLEGWGHTVLRAKLEETLFDTKDGDLINEIVGLVVARDLEKMGE